MIFDFFVLQSVSFTHPLLGLGIFFNQLLLEKTQIKDLELRKEKNKKRKTFIIHIKTQKEYFAPPKGYDHRTMILVKH